MLNAKGMHVHMKCVAYNLR